MVYDHLSPLQRAFVLALMGQGVTRSSALVTALAPRRKSTVWRVATDLVQAGVVLKHGRGRYSLNPKPPELRPRPGCLALDPVLRRALAEGPVELQGLAHRFGVTVKTIHNRLAPLLLSGDAVRVRPGVYSLKESK